MISVIMASYIVMIDSPGQLKALIMQKEAETDIREKVHEISLFMMDKGNALRVAHFFPWLRSMNFEKIYRGGE
jgi:hypothetical protein